jgi:hypothetical protein
VGKFEFSFFVSPFLSLSLSALQFGLGGESPLKDYLQIAGQPFLIHQRRDFGPPKIREAGNVSEAER